VIGSLLTSFFIFDTMIQNKKINFPLLHSRVMRRAVLPLVLFLWYGQMVFAASISNVPPDSSAALKQQWRYCGDPFLMDLACIDSVGVDMLLHPLIAQARTFYGLRDIEGSSHEPKVLMFFHETGNTKIKNDESAWCSVFMGFCAKKQGLQFSKYMNARSWLNVGDTVSNPQPGDVVVFWREKKDSWKGHVSIYLGKSADGKELYCLGGNQNDEVCIQTYEAETVLGFRRIKAKPLVSGK
jgi:uncharacterized protein (TIGR02594 family)